jgi:hypothetical protein
MKGGPAAESAGSQAGPARGDLRLTTKPKLFASGPGAAEPTQQNMVTVEYRDALKIEESERTRLLRILKKQAVVKGSAGKRLTEEERAAEMEKIERRGMQDLLKKTIIEEEYQIDYWYFDTLGWVVTETKTQALGGELNQIEELLYACDLELLRQRKVLVTMLKSVEHGMDDREYSIREQLR